MSRSHFGSAGELAASSTKPVPAGAGQETVLANGDERSFRQNSKSMAPQRIGLFARLPCAIQFVRAPDRAFHLWSRDAIRPARCASTNLDHAVPVRRWQTFAEINRQSPARPSAQSRLPRHAPRSSSPSSAASVSAFRPVESKPTNRARCSVTHPTPANQSNNPKRRMRIECIGGSYEPVQPVATAATGKPR